MAVANSSRDSRSRRRASRPSLEAMEARIALSASAGLAAAGPRVAVVGEALIVEGTPGPDRIRILPTESPGVVRVIAGGRVVGRFGPVEVIDLAAGAGNDSVAVAPRITLPTRLDGGPGSDLLRGGSGANALLGGPGNDTLLVTPSRDTFDGGPGRTRTLASEKIGVVQVGPSAAGAGLRRLAGSHRLAGLRVAGPAIVGPADLRDAKVVGLLRASYEGGHTIALAGATEAAANKLAALLGDPRPVDLPDASDRADLVAFRKVADGQRASYEVSVLLPTAGPVTRQSAATGIRLADRRYLGRVFSPTPQRAASPFADDPDGDLTRLAAAYNSSTSYTDPNGNGQTQIFETVFSIRSFAAQEDFFYFTQEVQSSSFAGTLGQIGTNVRIGRLDPTTPGLKQLPLLIQPSPLDNQGTNSYTTSVNTSWSTTVGWNQTSGFNASINNTVTLQDSHTVSVPPISIQYVPNNLVNDPGWIFESTNGSVSEMVVSDSWVWRVPFSAYSPGQTLLPYIGAASISTADGPEEYQVEDKGFAPLPFGDTFALATPVVSAVSQPTVKPGDTFSITGSAFYPSLVTGVLLGGQALNPANYTVASSGQINVVAPPTILGQDLNVEVQTTVGASQGSVTISILSPSQVSVQPRPISAVAGQAFANLAVGVITDSDQNAPASGFSATIDWGDGNTSPGTVNFTGPGQFTLSGSHTYAAAGNYTFSLQVTDPNGTRASATGAATVTAETSQVAVQALPLAAVAGQALSSTTVATVTDSNLSANPSAFSAAIAWGDGTTSPGTLVATGTPGAFDVVGSHTYATAGSYTFGVQVTDPQGSKGSATGAATVSPPSTGGGVQNLAAQPIAATAGRAFTNVTAATFTDSDFGVLPSDFVASIDWGDGIVTAITTVQAVPSGFVVLGTHMYATPGAYTFRVQVVDASNRKTVVSGVATVSPSA